MSSRRFSLYVGLQTRTTSVTLCRRISCELIFSQQPRPLDNPSKRTSMYKCRLLSLGASMIKNRILSYSISVGGLGRRGPSAELVELAIRTLIATTFLSIVLFDIHWATRTILRHGRPNVETIGPTAR